MKTKTITLSANEAASQLQISTDTLTRGLKAVGIAVGHGKRFSLAEIFRAVGGDLKFERARHERAVADRVERQNQVDAGELVEFERIEKHITDRLVNPIITAMEQCPKEAEQWLETVLKPAVRVSLQPTKQ